MNLNTLIQQVYYEPSLITPEAHASIRRLLESRLGTDGTDGPIAAERRAVICGEAVALPSMQVRAGIAHIPVAEAIGQKLSGFAKYGGAVDVADVHADLNEAEADPKVRGIILEMDSPGGMVSGTAELAHRIEQVRKPIYAFSDGLVASAAYWIASATDGIFTTVTATSGSIGVLLPWVDQSKAFEKAGLKVELIKAGRLKGAGFPGTSLSDEQRANLQERVDHIYGMFRKQVLRTRPGVKDETMQGQAFLAEQAMSRGLIDGIVSNISQVAALI